MRTLTLLGATGSIGDSTLSVVAQHPEQFSIYALSAHQQVDKLARLCVRFTPAVACVHTASQAQTLATQLKTLMGAHAPEVVYGEAGLIAIARAPAVHTVVAAIVGAAGLPPALAAAQAGKTILLANKEALVAAGPLFMQAIATHGATLLPIDSEHNALLQCLPRGFAGEDAAGVESLLLTASGGPFWQRDPTTLAQVTVAEAVAHPQWKMGQKISVDSATMVNKGLEVIEAHWLFNMPASRIKVVIHPQSIIHSFVNYCDGSSLAQLGAADMRIPISHALAYPARIRSGVAPLDFAQLSALTFAAPDHQRFPALPLCYQALEAGQIACIHLNAANEVAVAAFLAGQIGFTQIAQIIDMALTDSRRENTACTNLAEVLAQDARARQNAQDYVEKFLKV